MFLWIFIWGLCFREGYSGRCYSSYECTQTCYRGERFIHKCGTWGWKRCSGYRRQGFNCQKTCYRSFCCSGYEGYNCNIPICYGSTTCSNGGTCQSPDTCRCRTGYRSPYCNDINECNDNTDGCQHSCTNTHGSYYCSCRTGYTLGSNRKSCYDRNECNYGNGGCQHNCINTHGSYYCSCRTGYTLGSNRKSCFDVNECNTNNGGCEKICKNSIGSFTCDCTDGYKLNTDKKTCSDVNECALGTSDCEQICNNTEGSYTCSCNNGYVLAIDGKKCEDIDECSLQSNQCTEYCQNTQGSYFCYCDTGFEITSDGLSCQDVNECALGTSDCEHDCNNTEGSYTCSCNSGYVLAIDEKKCEDIDECSLQSNQCTENSSCQDVNKCALGTSDCEHICINTEGSYTCSCKSGYVLTIDGKTCEDEDECLKGNITCDQICINVVGSYKCECHSGYTMADRSSEENTCHDIDECGENTPGCSQICNNTDGSYFCDCYRGYSLDNDNKTCLVDDDCEGVICQNGGSCLDRLDSFTCICNEGFGGALCEADINECEILNGGCQDICMNTFGSFNCNCLEGRGLNEDGFSCKENNISVFERLQIPRQLLPKACFTVKLVECTDERSSDIFLSSTSEWYRLNSNPNVVYTFGIVFVKSNFSLPISLRGVEFTTRNEDFTLNYGVHYDSANGTVIENNLTTTDCQAFELIKSDMFDFISVDSFTKTFLLSLFPVLPYWLEFEKSSTEILAVQDIKSDLVYGRNMDDVTWCAGAPVLPNHLYTVFKLNTGLKISLLGDEVDLPKPVQSRKFCLIVDLCQTYGGTVFLMIPEESRDSLLELNIFKTLKKEWRIDIKPRGFGISLENGINAGYHSFSGELWNGDNMFLPLLPQVDFWIGCKLLKHHRYFTVNGSADIYMRIPSVQKMLTSVFREEWTGVIDIQLSLSPVLRFKLFGEKYLVSFPSATAIAYASLGGSSRMLCDDVSNPEGVFLSATVETNPFKGIPYLEDLYPDLSHRMFLFVITDKGQNASGRNSIRIKDRILEIESLLNDTMAVLDDALDKIVPFQEMVIEMRITINTIGNILRQKFGESSVLIENLEDGFIDIHQMLYKYRSTLYNLADKTEFIVNTTTEQLVELLRTHALLLTQSIRDVSHDITRNILSSFGNYTGLGFKFTCHWTVFGLELFWIDMEIVYSEEEFFRCSRFDETRKLLNGESAFRILGRFTRKNKLGRFLSCNKGFGLGSALAINSRNVMLQLEASINMLGIEVTGDLFISKNGINFYLEGNVWNIFLVQIDVSAEVDKEWNQLIFSLQGQFVARANSERVNTSSSLMQSNYLEDIGQRRKSQVQTDSFSFQDSYLDALIKAVGLISGVAEKRVSQAQVALSIAQKNVQKAKSWLDEKKLAVRKANVIFDNAVKSLEVARGNIEAAKGPFAEALEKLKNAQKNIDNLCKIRNCSNICIPGIRCKICFFKGFSGIKFRHPCCWSTECMISFPDPLCLLANLACRIIRTAAYVILELAKIFVRTAMLTFDIAKAAVTVAQIVVDKSRVILTVAEGILELANIGLEVAEGILKAAKFALAAIKQVIEASVKVLQFVIEYGLKNIIDVRNCGFNIELSTRDMPVFDVVCEVNPFRLGWTKIKLRINFKNIFQSLWQAAKATISAIINIFDGIFSDRRRHDIEFDASTRMHVLLRTIRKSNGLNNTDTYWNETIDIVNDIAGFGDKVESDSENRIQLFSEKCKKMTVIQDFMQVAFQSLQEVSNESKSYILEIVNVKELLKGYSNVRPNVDITLDNVGISKEYAEKDFNMTDSDLQRAVEDIKSAVADDPLLVEIQKAADVSKQCLEDEAQSVESVDYQNAWFTSMDNMTRKYFNKSECVGFKDCIFYSISCLYDLYEYEDIPNITIIRQSILDIENKLIEAFQNESSSIQDTSLAMDYVLYRINALIEMNIFCSKPPEFLTRLQNQTVIYGNEVQFFCHVKGDPEPSYVWLLNDTVIENENKCRLILSKVTDENSYDKYNCVAGNVVANVTSTDAYITVVLEDEDECQTENGNCQQFCNNTVGSYFCSCFDGFEPDDQNKYICKDTDECQTENGSCQQFCNNTVGSYFCSCFEGFIPDEQNKYLCKDSDECEKDNGGCQHACTNEEVSFTCSCKGGFILQSDSRTCVDVDECKTNNGECQHNCTNEAGTFICSCRSGYELHVNDSSCIDIDECKTNNGGCQHKCSNELGSFSCSCNDGFSLHSDNKTCTEISECILKSIGCQHTCINETESFTCLCYDGYELETNNKSCNDINECKANMSACQHTCFNTVGSFYCTCLAGYQLENDGTTCSDIDECEEGNSGCEHICRNTEGSFQCACSNGFKLTMDNKTCADINECETDNGGCEHKCINTDGSFTCFCEDGFKLEKDVKSCMHVNASDESG